MKKRSRQFCNNKKIHSFPVERKFPINFDFTLSFCLYLQTTLQLTQGKKSTRFQLTHDAVASINRQFDNESRASNRIPSHKSYEREIENQMHTFIQSHLYAYADGLIDDEYEYRVNFRSQRQMRSQQTEIEIESVGAKKQKKNHGKWRMEMSRTSGDGSSSSSRQQQQ